MTEITPGTYKKTNTVEKKDWPYSVSVHFQNSTRSYTFGTYLENLVKGDKVVVETSQGIELGECSIDARQIASSSYVKDGTRPVLRKASEEDIDEYENNLIAAKEAFEICAEEIKESGLKMHLLSSEYMLDRSKILFVYQSEQRVDFRELLKKLGAKLKCRIELRQIGERDKAKMCGGIGMCGMELCCTRFKTHMDVISINMAKTQMLALNTEKLSGMCGKLMCCLKYENDNYKQLTEGLPKLGAHIEYEGGIYRVSSINVMTNEARIENAESFQIVTCDELREKAILRKGVAIARHSAKRGPKTNLTHGAARENHIPGVKQQNASATGVDLEKAGSFSISSESREYHSSDLKPRNEHKTNRPRMNDMHAGLVPQKEEKKAAPKNNSRNRNRTHINPKNPNVTVRSFKSSRTRAAEQQGEKE